MDTAIAVAGILWDHVGIMTLGVAIGLVVGALPGFGTVNTYVVLFPITLAMQTEAALVLLTAIAVGNRLGGAYTAIVLNVPGSGSDVVDTFDGYPMTRMGRGMEALGIAVGASTIGGLIAGAIAWWGTPAIAEVALRFGSPQLAVLLLISIIIVGRLTAENTLKGVLSSLLGLMIGLVGLDPMWGVARANFGSVYLTDGVPLVPALVGVFAVREMIELTLRRRKPSEATPVPFAFRALLRGVAVPFLLPLSSLRATLVGLSIGALPGPGATLASFVAYQQEVAFARVKALFGKGDPRGLIAGEASDNAAAVGAVMPLLALGIPGSASTAILMVMMGAHGVGVGPMLFMREPTIPFTILGAFLAAVPVMFVLGIVFARLFGPLAHLKPALLLGVLAVMTTVGAFTARNAWFDVGIAIAFGLLALVMIRTGYPPNALVIGLILAPLFERRFFEGLRMGFGDPAIFFRGGIAQGAWLLLAIIMFAPPVLRWLRKRLSP